MPELGVKTGAALDKFNGRWALDLRRSDPITPMLAALKTPYLIRKVAANMRVEQTIRVDGDKFEIKNVSSLGTSSVIHMVNAGEIVLTDPNGEQTLDQTFVDDTAELPLVIRAVLPKGKGFTKDSRRIISNETEMEQLLEYRSDLSAEPIVLHRYWNRIGKTADSANHVTGNGPEIKIKSSPPIAIEIKPELRISAPEAQPALEAPVSIQTPVPVKIALVSDKPTERDPSKKDWATGILLFGFFTSSWFRSDYLECAFLAALLLLNRSDVLFPAPVKGAENTSDWWNLPNARFAATAIAMRYATRVILSPISDDPLTTLLESLLAVSAYGWTRRFDIIQMDIATLFQSSKTPLPTAWMEICGLGLMCTLALTMPTSDMDTGAGQDEITITSLVLTVILYGAARYRIHVLSLSPGGIHKQDARASSLVTPAEITGSGPQNQHASGSSPMTTGRKSYVRVTSSRVVTFAAKPFAQYLVEVEPPAVSVRRPSSSKYVVWCRYRDLRLLRDEIAKLYAVHRWSKLPFFPPKTWSAQSSTDATVMNERQIQMDKFFSSVFEDHGDSIIELDCVRRLLQMDDMLHHSLEETRESTRLLGSAKRFCENASAVGEADEWVLVKPDGVQGREYLKRNAMQTTFFKTVKVVQARPHVLIQRIMKDRTAWDPQCVGQLGLREILLDEEDALKTFGGMIPYAAENLETPNKFGAINITRVVRTNRRLLDFKPHDLVVFQVALEDDRTGRFMFVECSVDPDFEDRAQLLDENVEMSKFHRDTVIANGFVLEPLAGGKTLLTAIRAEEHADEPFRIASIL